MEMSAALVDANSSVTRPAMYAKLPYDVANRPCSPVASAITPSTLVVTCGSVGELGFCRSRLQPTIPIDAAATATAHVLFMRMGACLCRQKVKRALSDQTRGIG